MNLLRRFMDHFHAPESTWDPIRLTESGFTAGTQSICWSALTQIAAFKRDRLTLDDVWFEFSSDNGVLHVCEEQPGFKALLAVVEERFPSVAGWEQHVIHPPFAENYTVLYVRPTTPT